MNTTSFENKSTVAQIRERFDNDVARFANLQTGQSATIDAPLVLDLITAVATGINPKATASLDVGCGAGNYTLKLLENLPNMDTTIIDLSQPMLDKAAERIAEVSTGKITAVQGDIREIELGEAQFDVITAAAVLHHLREEEEWYDVFSKFYRALKPGGSIWISDLVTHSTEAVHAVMWSRYGDYLTNFKDEAYRDLVFDYIDKEDTPRPVLWQLNVLQSVGFKDIEILHKNSVFAAFGAIKN